MDCNDDLANSEVENPKMREKINLTSQQKQIFVIFFIINIFITMCRSLQAPFYPAEAEKKHMTPSVYGFVFGVFELVTFVACPIFGKYIEVIGPKFMLVSGNFVLAICSILFGFLDKVSEESWFVALSFAIRITEALGEAGSITSSFAILAYEFPNDVAKTFSALETSIIIGITSGPTLGGLLYDIGGFMLPFLVSGSCLFFITILTFFMVPTIDAPHSTDASSSLSIMKVFQIPAVAISYYATFAQCYSTGFILVTLEPQLRQFQLSTSLVGVIFVIGGLTYALTAVFWGILADRYVPPSIICATGGAIISVAFLLFGPVPYLPIEPVLWLEVVALVLHGFGKGAIGIATFVDSSREALRNGYPDNTQTFGLISGLWSSGCSLGSFLGPTVTGLTLENLTIRECSLIVLGQHLLVIILSLWSFWYNKKLTKNGLEESYALVKKS